MNKKTPIAVVFDMDECIGSWSYAGVLYGILQYLGVEDNKRSKYLYIKHLFPSVIRPNFDKCMRLLHKQKTLGNIDDIIIYTANTGVGYPEFIKECLERYAGTPGLFTRILVTHRSGESDKMGYKNLKMLTKLVNKRYKPPYNNVLCFDDKSEVWASGNGSQMRVIQVPPYTGDPLIPVKELVSDLSRYYNIDDIFTNLSRRFGDITYLTPTPNIINNTNLFQLLNGFLNTRGNIPNSQDDIVKNMFIPNIKQHINKHINDPSISYKKTKQSLDNGYFNRHLPRNNRQIITINKSGKFNIQYL